MNYYWLDYNLCKIVENMCKSECFLLEKISKVLVVKIY